MRKYYCSGFFIFYLILGVVNVNNELLASSLKQDSITIKKCQDFKITGKGNSDFWNSTEWINLVQRRQNPPIYKTKVKVLYSETGIYFLFDCEDKKLTSIIKNNLICLHYEITYLFCSDHFSDYCFHKCKRSG